MKTRKLLALMIVPALLFVCVFTLTACGAQHTHDWNYWEVTTTATCTVTGVETRTCTDAGCSKTETRAIPIGASAHVWGGTWVVTDNTATADGYETCTCTLNPAHTATKPGGTKGLEYDSIDTPATAYRVNKGTAENKNIVIPATYKGLPVTGIVVGTFKDTTIESVVIPASVEEIESKAFMGCTNLKSVTFASGSQLKYIRDDVFEDCNKIESITIPSSLEYIGFRAFYQCKSLKTVIFENGSKLQTIGGEAFSVCSALVSIVIPKNINIGKDAFNNSRAGITVYSCYSNLLEWNVWVNDQEFLGGGKNYELTNATRKYYSEQAPATNPSNYWRYVNGVPTVWA